MRILLRLCCFILLTAGLYYFQKFDTAQRAAIAAPQADPPAAPRQTLSLTAFQDCSDCPAMLIVPAGSFAMGTPRTEVYRQTGEGPQHQVTLKPFALGKNDVTFAEWDACVAGGGCNGYSPNDKDWGRGRNPVIDVSWDDAQAYIRWLAAKTGRPYRLPSEAEWEYAARAGTTTAHYWGDAESPTLANCGGCDSPWKGRTAPTGSFPPNPWGFFDMTGNVSQWLRDCYNKDYNNAPADGTAWTTGDCSRRMDRGGNWAGQTWDMRIGHRHYGSTEGRYGNFGFRVAMTLSP